MIRKVSVHMKNKSLVVLLDVTYIEHFNIFLYSLLKNNDWFNYDINIFYWEDEIISKFDNLIKLYDKIIFNKIDISLYEDCLITTKWRTWNYNPFYRFEIFTLNTYSKIVYMDLDTLILGDISFLFDNDFDFSASEIVPGTGMEFHELYNRKRFNGGVLCISDKFLNMDVRNDLISMCEMESYSGNQTPINLYFQDIVNFMSNIYNFTLDFNIINFNDIKVLHFIGEKKPLLLKNDSFNTQDNFDCYVREKSILNCLQAMNIYFKYKKEFYDKYVC